MNPSPAAQSLASNPRLIPPMKSSAHPGFRTVAARIADKEGVSKKSAGAILANASRNASKSAKKANPRLNRVKG